MARGGRLINVCFETQLCGVPRETICIEWVVTRELMVVEMLVSFLSVCHTSPSRIYWEGAMNALLVSARTFALVTELSLSSSELRSIFTCTQSKPTIVVLNFCFISPIVAIPAVYFGNPTNSHSHTNTFSCFFFVFYAPNRLYLSKKRRSLLILRHVIGGFLPSQRSSLWTPA